MNESIGAYGTWQTSLAWEAEVTLGGHVSGSFIVTLYSPALYVPRAENCVSRIILRKNNSSPRDYFRS